MVEGQRSVSGHGSNGHLTHGTDQQLEFKAAVMFPIMRQKHSTNNLKNTVGPWYAYSKAGKINLHLVIVKNTSLTETFCIFVKVV